MLSEYIFTSDHSSAYTLMTKITLPLHSSGCLPNHFNCAISPNRTLCTTLSWMQGKVYLQSTRFNWVPAIMRQDIEAQSLGTNIIGGVHADTRTDASPNAYSGVGRPRIVREMQGRGLPMYRLRSPLILYRPFIAMLQTPLTLEAQKRVKRQQRHNEYGKLLLVHTPPQYAV
jgi:hypothetical protein